MSERFHITGDDIYFGGYRVGLLIGSVPATVRDRVEGALELADPDAMPSDEYEAECRRIKDECDKATARLEKKLEVKETECGKLDDANTALTIELADARAEIETLKSLVRAP